MSKSNDLLGKLIKCKYCKQEQAQIILEDRRYWVRCVSCGASYPLSTQNIT